MIYYNRKHKKINLNKFTIFSYGGCSTIYKKDNIIFKEYYEESDYVCAVKISEKVFDILSAIDSPYLIKLYDLYTKSYNSDKTFIIDGYTAAYYEKSNINFLFSSIDYILDNINGLEQLFDLLAKLNISVRDVRLDNTIIGDEYITMIDPDLYKIQGNDIDLNRFMNKRALLSLINQLLFKFLDDAYLYDQYEVTDLTDYLNLIEASKLPFNDINIQSNTNLTDTISRRLKPYNTLFDYLNKECRKD